MPITQTDGVMLLSMAKTVRQRQFVLALLATQHVERPLIPEVRFNLDAMTDANAVLDYRFDVVGIRKLGYYLGLPAVVVTENWSRALRDEAMCIVLGRMAFPTRLHGMSKTFGRSRSSICDVFLHTINLLYEIWGNLLYFNLRLVAKNIQR
ncbi:hypothetical protein H257_04388 [Aphanomyces astaci]|uniref:DDE Tnp4 domain-containing protein n=1 Tax=Aphanomyces astaci TaxID=112090 RepID=W4GVQ4_APHAT|nr:hypothetical protein H257_04388 [Aphanomyces astaci]ETV83757.1 hypothetical protein H257_04388 [Aphanomyces astaci]|eukprot:XP_009827187.1 hypothetical protein H257_04388 [Aphanomyces astaci]